MTARERRPGVLIKLFSRSAYLDLWQWTCGGCGKKYIRKTEDVHTSARQHAAVCILLAFVRLRHDVRRHADLLRTRAIVLSVVVEQQTRMTLPWVELRKVADELDELTGLVRSTGAAS